MVEQQYWRLDTLSQTLVFSSVHASSSLPQAEQMPAVVYWGERLAATTDETLQQLVQGLNHSLLPGTLDQPIRASICPEYGRAYAGAAGILAAEKGKPLLTQFVLEQVTVADKSLVFTATDTLYQLRYQATFSVRGDVICCESSLENLSDKSYQIDWFSAPAMLLSDRAESYLEFAGRWTQEFGLQSVPFQRGVHSRRSHRGRTGHDHFPAVLVPEPSANWQAGNVQAVHYAHSAAHKMQVEQLTDGQRVLQAGIDETVILPSGEQMNSGQLHLTFSSKGLNGIARQYQAYLRQHILPPVAHKIPRPVHYNCWEAVYFDHDIDKLKSLANKAAAIGVERFVLDDGWFGQRDDDTTSLGDWTVHPQKYPQGLQPLISHINSLGMEFGLWFEPEMVNEDSELARRHPEWLIKPDNRQQYMGRQQQVLDLTQAAVVEYLFESVDSILSAHPIRYVKWDMNRDITLGVDRQGFLLLRPQTAALLGLIQRLTEAHPEVMFESCASGGGRIDYDFLQYMPRVWLSDSNDAHERCLMQSTAALFLPPEVIGSHIGPKLCHTSHRQLSMEFRAIVSMMAHMGLEMDLAELTEQEQTVATHYIQLYKQHRAWMHQSTQYQLTDFGLAISNSSQGSQSIIQYVNTGNFSGEASAAFMVIACQLAVNKDESTAAVRLQGLIPEQRYRLRVVNYDLSSNAAFREFQHPLMTEQGLVLEGDVLMKVGLRLPVLHPDSALVLLGELV